MSKSHQNKTNIDALLDKVLLEAELLNLRANLIKCGWFCKESFLDKGKAM